MAKVRGDRGGDRRRAPPRPPRVLHLGERRDRSPAARPAGRPRSGGHRDPRAGRRHGVARRAGPFFRPLIEAGGQVAWFNPLSLLRIRRRRADFRSHRKIVVCDGRVGFTGGMNVADTETAEFSGSAAWRDTHTRFEGSAVRVLQRVFAEDWLYATGWQAAPRRSADPGVRQVRARCVPPPSAAPDLWLRARLETRSAREHHDETSHTITELR
jgi:phosphatidylserine/phosphatidylglycerophosphate/cardiolipin synthase-like enzyme